MRRLLVLLVFVGLSANPAAAAGPATGNWKVVVVNNYLTDVVESIIKLEQADGKWSAELVAAAPFLRNVKVDSVSVDKNHVRLVIMKGNTESVFEGTLDGDKMVIGNFGDDRRVTAAKLIWTEEDKLTRESAFVRKTAPAPMQDMQKAQQEVFTLRGKLGQAKEDDDKKTLRDQIKKKQEEVDSVVPGLLKKTMADHADDPAAMDAAMMLLRSAKKYDVTLTDAKKWAELVTKASQKYGTRYEQEMRLALAEALVNHMPLRPLAAEMAKRADADMGPKASAARQVRVLTALVTALGTAAEAKPFAERLDKLETVLDKEYIAKHAKLEIAPYAGRKDGGNKTVLLELFTGAQCPPCVAADIAFDKLCENYKQSDVILLQYHMHIPGPDPLTNTDTEARWKYYTEAFPNDVGGVPTSIFNGKPDSGGGGGEDAALDKLKAYRKIIDPLLNEEFKARLTVKAERQGDVVKIDASVSDLAEHGDGAKLRFALVEESIRYAGSNGIRFHHHVVRAMPGGADGIVLAGPSESKQVSVNLTELRGNLTKYLDDFVEKRGPFPKPQRPMDMKHLKAVAWIQNDKDDDRAVLQAVMVDVK